MPTPATTPREEAHVHVVRDGPLLVLAGDFDVRSTWQVRAAVDEALAAHQHVVVDLTGVGSVDVVALRVLAAASRRAVREEHHLTLRGCNGAVRRMLHLTHLIRMVEVERHPTQTVGYATRTSVTNA